MDYKHAFAVLFFALIPFASAEITIQMPEDVIYNLGDLIDASISIKELEQKNGFFKLQIVCDDRSVQYYVSPLSIEADTRTEVDAPPIRIPQGLLDDCKLRADFETSFGENIDSEFSSQFHVSDKLDIILEENLTVEPGHKAVITASVRKEDADMAKDGDIKLFIGGEEQLSSFKDGMLTEAVDMGNAPRGFYAIRIEASDEFGNKGELVAQLEVLGVAQRIENKLSKQTLLPRETLTISPVVLDQTDEPLNKTVHLSIMQDEKVFAAGDLILGESFSFPIENTLKPGKYAVHAAFAELEAQDSFIISESKEISMLNNEHIVTIKNVGNVRYEDEVTIAVEGSERSFSIAENIDLKVNEQTIVDLSKKVSAGNYVVKLQQTQATLYIPDNRNIVIRKFDGLGSITGMAISKVYNARSLIGTVLFLVIVCALALFWGPKVYRSVRKKEEEQSIDHIFDDLRKEGKGPLPKK